MKANQLFDLTGKIALVTGGGTGLGRQYAIALADNGATVILSGRRTAPLEDTAAEIRKAGGTAHCLAMDATNEAAIAEAFKTVASLGGIDVLVNNAGAGAAGGLVKMKADDWDAVMNINLKGAWLVARAAANLMIEQGRGGSIINISSMMAVMSQKAMGAYCASKAGLTHLTRTMALEWARYGIRVNTIQPGYYLTDLSAGFLEHPNGQAMVKSIPMRRLGKPEEMDGAILLLASNAGSYMTGTALTIDGGQSFPVTA